MNQSERERLEKLLNFGWLPGKEDIGKHIQELTEGIKKEILRNPNTIPSVPKNLFLKPEKFLSQNPTEFFQLERENQDPLAVLFDYSISIEEFLSVYFSLKDNPNLINDINRIIDKKCIDQSMEEPEKGNKTVFAYILLGLFYKFVLIEKLLPNFDKQIYLKIINVLIEIIFFQIHKENMVLISMQIPNLCRLLHLTYLETEAKKIILNKIKQLTRKSVARAYDWELKEVYVQQQPYNFLHLFLTRLEMVSGSHYYSDAIKFFINIVTTYICQTYRQKSFNRICNLNNKQLNIERGSILLILREKYLFYESRCRLNSMDTQYNFDLMTRIDVCKSYGFKELKSRLKIWSDHVVEANKIDIRPVYKRALEYIDRELGLVNFKIENFPVYQQHTKSCVLSSILKIHAYWTKQKLKLEERENKVHVDLTKQEIEIETEKLEKRLKKEEDIKNFINNLRCHPKIKETIMQRWSTEGSIRFKDLLEWRLLQFVAIPAGTTVGDIVSLDPGHLYEALRTYGPLFTGGYLDSESRAEGKAVGEVFHAVCVIGIVSDWFVIISDPEDDTYKEHLIDFPTFHNLMLSGLRKDSESDQPTFLESLFGVKRAVSLRVIEYPFWYDPHALYQYNDNRV